MLLTACSIAFILLALVAAAMSIRSIFSWSGTTRLRLTNGSSVDIVHDTTDNKIKYLDALGTVQTVGSGSVITPTAAVALVASQSGSEVFLNAAGGFAITLPAPAANLKFRFTVAANFATTNFTVVTASGANLFFGGATVAGADVPCAAQDSINFVATAELKGDFVDVWSDGTSWFVNGRGTTAGSITFTVT